MGKSQGTHTRQVMGWDDDSETWVALRANAIGQLEVVGGGLAPAATVLKVQDGTTSNLLTVDAAGKITIANTEFSVGNFPAEFPLPVAQVAELKDVDVQNFPAEFPLPAAQVTTLTPPSTVDIGNFPATQPVSIADPIEIDSRIKRLLKFEPSAGEEIRREETTTDDYHGAAPDGSLTTDAVWDVVRFYKTDGKIVRVRFRSDIAWDDRAVGW